MFAFSKNKITNQPKSILMKKEQKNLQSLKEEVHKSRIAIEYLAQFRKDCPQQNVNIDQIKHELSQCMTQINYQQKKHVQALLLQHLLKELIGFLKGQMNKIQLKDMEAKQKDMEILDKKIKHIRQDIDKILLKKNHEVAKIAVLKQTASQNRSQRVVFSNLFKKLEKELKQSQQMYKNELLRGEKNRNDLQNQLQRVKSVYGKQTRNTNVDNHSYFIQQTQSWTIKHCVESPSQKMHCKAIQNSLGLLKLESSDSKPFSESEQKKTQQDAQGLTSRQTKSRIVRTNPSKQNYEGYDVVIQELQKFCNRIKVQTDCSSIQQIILLINGIEDQNSSLQEQISDVNSQIQRAEKERHQIQVSAYEQQIICDEFQQFQVISSSKKSKCSLKKQKKSTIKRMPSDKFNRQYSAYLQIEPQFQKQQNNKALYRQFTQILSLFDIKLDNSTSNLQIGRNAELDIQKVGQIYLKQKSEQIDKKVSMLSQFFVNKKYEYICGSKCNSSNLSNNNNSNNIEKPIKTLEHSQQIQPNTLFASKNKNTNRTKVSYIQQIENQNHIHESSSNPVLSNMSPCFLQRRQISNEINTILAKMNKFGSCEKFFDREGFFGEYRKQMNKKAKFNNLRA